MIYAFEPKMDYVASVTPGETFKVNTHDCFLGQIESAEQDYATVDEEKGNPATGPILVEGAEKGDLLKVEVLKIDLATRGVSILLPQEGVLGDQVEKPYIRLLPRRGEEVVFGDLSLPIRPMIGVIGVAPAEEDGLWETHTPWKHGGNLDCTEVKPGAALYFTVNHEGALLALGDCHALMGDGEVGCAGGEIAAQVTLKTSLIKGKTAPWPLLETKEATMVIASGETLEEAVYSATEETVRLLEKALKLSWEEAYMLCSLVIDFKINQVVNPMKTVRAVIPKSLAPTSLILSAL